MATPVTQLHVYFGTSKLKEAVEKYAKDQHMAIWEVIADAWRQMLSSGDLSLAFKTLYEVSTETGIPAKANQEMKRFKLSMPPELVQDVDDAIEDYKKKHEKVVINRSLFNQEALRRYVEPRLISMGYLDNTQFKNNYQAVKNIINFRNALKLNRKEFHLRFFTIYDEDAKKNIDLVSYPQYAVIERTSKGNVDHLLDLISERSDFDAEKFYLSTEDFLEYLKETSNLIDTEKY